jgi:hypothetical protein
MPFVDKNHRLNPDINIPGDRCYLKYAQIMEMWRAEPRWTTVDEIYKWVKEAAEEPDMQRAKELAFMVFFNLHVMPYELKKMKDNGDIR